MFFHRSLLILPYLLQLLLKLSPLLFFPFPAAVLCSHRVETAPLWTQMFFARAPSLFSHRQTISYCEFLLSQAVKPLLKRDDLLRFHFFLIFCLLTHFIDFFPPANYGCIIFFFQSAEIVLKRADLFFSPSRFLCCLLEIRLDQTALCSS